MQNIKVLSVGGSIIAPGEVDVNFLKQFRDIVKTYLDEDPKRGLIFVSGGGAPARQYQQAYREIASEPKDSEADWIGIAATWLNGHLLKSIFSEYCRNELVVDPTAAETMDGRILVAGGWKPGFSTDNDAVLLAERFGADTVINLSNIAKIYTADPKVDPNAQPIDHIPWDNFRKMVGDKWTPGVNLPFDPIAAMRGQKLGLRVISASGGDLKNIDSILRDGSFEGSVIGPD
ncbi:MAG: UMP kinase [Spirochaetia bacterium]